MLLQEYLQLNFESGPQLPTILTRCIVCRTPVIQDVIMTHKQAVTLPFHPVFRSILEPNHVLHMERTFYMQISLLHPCRKRAQQVPQSLPSFHIVPPFVIQLTLEAGEGNGQDKTITEMKSSISLYPGRPWCSPGPVLPNGAESTRNYNHDVAT